MSRRDLCVLAGFLLFLLIYFSGVLALPGKFCLGRPEGDARNQFYGWRAYGFGEVRAGRFPLWNPYEFLGMPFVAGLQSAMFYPTNWLCAVLPLGRAINLGIILNLFLSGLFTYLWTRRCGLKWVGAIVAASAYVFGAPQFLRIFEGHWSFLASMPWIPCLLLCVEIIVSGGFQPLAIAAGAGAVAMQWFGGNPQYAFYGGIAASLYLAGRLWQRREIGGRAIARALGSFAAIYVLGSVLAGVQLFPALELFSVSSRKGQLSSQWVAQDSFAPESLLTFLAPDFFGSDTIRPWGQYWGQWNLWEMSAYVGVVVIGLAFVGVLRGERRKVLLASFVAAACLVLALGANGPALRLLYGTVPGFNLFRGLARFLCPMSLFLGLLAGMGADGVVGAAKGESRGSLRRAMWILAALAAILAVGGLALVSGLRPAGAVWGRFMNSILTTSLNHHPDMVVTPELQWAAMSQAGFSLLRAAAFLGALVFVIQTARRSSPANASRIAAVLLLLVAADAWSFGRRYLQTSPADPRAQSGVFDPQRDGLSKGAVARLKQVPEPFRYARGGCFTLPPCEGMTHELACIEGVQPNVPARFEDVFWAIQGQSKGAHRTSYSIFRLQPAFRMFNLRYLVAYPSQEVTRMPGLRAGVYEDEQIRIDELPNPWPRAWMVHRFSVIRDSGRLLEILPLFDYERMALLEERPGCAVEEPAHPDPAPEFTRYEPNRVELRVNAASTGLLVLSDLYYPGWRATVDGRPAEILCANYVMRAVAVAPGEHRVEFSYEPASFKAGVAASAAGGLGVALLILLHARSRKENT